MKLLYWDLETLKLSQQVEGGWKNIEAFGLSVAVVYDVNQKDYRHYYEDQVSMLIYDLEQADLAVGFNTIGFDCRVLNAYTDRLTQHTIQHFDMMKELKSRISLDSLAKGTLGQKKTMSGALAPNLWKQGKKKEVLEYCIQDVNLTKHLFAFACKENFLVSEKNEKVRRFDTSNWATNARQMASRKKTKLFEL